MENPSGTKTIGQTVEHKRGGGSLRRPPVGWAWFRWGLSVRFGGVGVGSVSESYFSSSKTPPKYVFKMKTLGKMKSLVIHLPPGRKN